MYFKKLKNILFLIFLFPIFYIIIKTNGNYKKPTSSIIKNNIKKVQKFYKNKRKQKMHYIESSINKINNKKNLLIGIIKNYNWYKIEPFFNSFKNAGFKNYEFIIFYDQLNKYTINKIKLYGIIMYNITKKCGIMNIINCRWKIYEDFLKENGCKYNYVFTTDVRDSIFQKDVFKYYDIKKPFLGVAIEDGFLSEKRNKNWLIRAYGEDLYKTIRNERIICLGTIWGTVDKFTKFASNMRVKLDSKWSITKKVTDQAVGNFLIYHDRMFNDCLIKSDNKNGFVMTIGLTNIKNITMDYENNILNGKGKIAAIIHQYDRKPLIVRKIKIKYCKKKNK